MRAHTLTGRLIAGLLTVALLVTACVPAASLHQRTGAAGLLRPPPAAHVATTPGLNVLRGPIPFPFEENRGQAPADLAYVLRSGPMQVGFGPGGQRYHLSDGGQCDPAAVVDDLAALPGRGAGRHATGCSGAEQTPVRAHVVASELVGASEARPVGTVPAETLVSYFKGQPEEWLVGVPAFHQVSYSDAWPGVEVRYERASSGLESTYVLAPGADPASIRIAWHGVDSGRLIEDGMLELTTPIGTLRESAPVAWQDSLWGRQPVATRFDLVHDGADGAPVEVGFRLGTYDPSRALTIDPTLAFAGYIGGTGFDEAYDIALDGSGAAYVTGQTGSDQGSFPAAVGPDLTYNGGPVDAFVVKVRPDGTGLVYAGYIGGSDDDAAYGIAVDGVGAAYIAGFSNSPQSSFPLLVGPDLSYNGGDEDAFVAKLSPSGSALVYAGYIGGDRGDLAHGIAVDGNGAVYVSGETESNQTTFPVTVGPDLTYGDFGDGFVAKVKVDGSGLDYAGYIGGTDDDIAFGVAVDSTGAAYVTGETDSTEATFPVAVGPDVTHNGSTDAFVAKINPTGSAFVYSGYVGGANPDRSRAVAIDGAGAAYITGATGSRTTFPAVGGPDLSYNGGNTDAFVSKVNPAGSALVYSGFIGGFRDDFAADIAVDGSGAAYVTGNTDSSETTFPVVGGPDLTYAGGFEDGFVAKVGPTGAGLVYASYIGGGPTEDHGEGIAVDAAGNAYVAGWTDSDQTRFPVLGGPDLTFGGLDDSFVAKFADDGAPSPATPTPTSGPGTITPTPATTQVPVNCTPRPAVRITVAPGSPGTLSVTVQAGGGSISRIEFGQPQVLVNASISVPGGPANQTQPFIFTPPAGQTSVQFTVTAPNRAASTTAHFTVTDGCGLWPTFVGGGAGSF